MGYTNDLLKRRIEIEDLARELAQDEYGKDYDDLNEDIQYELDIRAEEIKKSDA